MKKNGFKRPLHPFQLLSWAIFCLNCVISIILFEFYVEPFEKILWTFLLLVSHSELFVLGFLATYKDPSINKNNLAYSEYMCNICKIGVSPTSKHCGCCDRCVENFDHHCKWLNNCIGKPNYKLFISLLISLQVNSFLMIIACFLVVFENELWEEKVEMIILMVGILFIVLVNLVVFVTDSFLIILHCYLKVVNMTTYEFILVSRSEKGETTPEEENIVKQIESKRRMSKSVAPLVKEIEISD